MNQTLLGGARSMMEHAGMTKGFWAEAIGVAAHVLNCSPRKGLDWRTPYELLYGRIPEVSYLRVFGCRAWIYSEKQGKKFDARANPMVFVGYESGSKAFRLWNPKSRSIVVSANVRFNESELPYKMPTTVPTKPTASTSSLPAPPPIETVNVPITFPSEGDSNDRAPTPPPSPTPSGSRKGKELERDPSPRSPSPPLPSLPTSCSTSPDILPPSDDEDTPTLGQPRRHSKRVRKPVEKYSSSNTITTEMSESEGAKFDEHYVEQVEIYAATIMPGEPTGYHDAVNGPDADKWKEAMDDEID